MGGFRVFRVLRVCRALSGRVLGLVAGFRVWALGLCWGLGVLVGALEVPLRVQGLGM